MANQKQDSCPARDDPGQADYGLEAAMDTGLYFLDEHDMPYATPRTMRELLLARRRRGGVPDRFVEAVFADMNSRCKEESRVLNLAGTYARRFEPGRELPGMVICGSVGTGKTMAACAIVNSLRDRDIDARYVGLLSVFDRIKGAYARKTEGAVEEVIGDYIRPDLLVIDEIGVHHGTKDEKTVIYRVINGRYDALRPTILVGNLNRDEVEEYIGEHCMSRVLAGGGVVLVFSWDSRR